MNTFRDSLNQRLKDDEYFRKEYTAIQPEMEIIRTLIKARKEQNLTQADLAMRTGINQGDISRLERGNRNPSLNMLKKLADGLNMSLRIEFTPKTPASGHLS
jgi:transcriptional regulator with XRE-family HTH domain